MNRTEMKEEAQLLIMHQIGNALGYSSEMLASRGLHVPDADREEFGKILQREANRVAKIFGFPKAWTN